MTLRELLHVIRTERPTGSPARPALIRALLEPRGEATVKELALALAPGEGTAAGACERALRRSLPALVRRGLLVRQGDLLRLAVPPLGPGARARVRAACDEVLRPRVAAGRAGKTAGQPRTPPAGLHRGVDCPFCRRDFGDRTVAENGTVYAVPDGRPVSPGHMLVIPRRHVTTWFEMSALEHAHANELLRALRRRLLRGDPSIVGFNLGTNCGAAAGQTVMHAHIHLIPRRAGDAPHPPGGIRNAIPHDHAPRPVEKGEGHRRPRSPAAR